MSKSVSRPQREDYGFFGPGSVTWRLWTYPTVVIAFQRGIAIETLDPNLTAAVVDMGGVYNNPKVRFDRTSRYFLTIILGDSVSAIRASETLKRVHTKSAGVEPISGRPYSANDPESQLWIHMTAWHSVLKCYEQFGPGALPHEEEDRYWAECAVAAELQTIDIAEVPRSRQAVRAYFARWKPKLALSDDGHNLFHYFLKPGPRLDALPLSTSFRAMSFASVATMPRWIRRLAGVDQNWAMDAVATLVARRAVLALLPIDARLAGLSQISPLSCPLLEDALRGAPPKNPNTVTPKEARAQVLPAT